MKEFIPATPRIFLSIGGGLLALHAN